MLLTIPVLVCARAPCLYPYVPRHPSSAHMFTQHLALAALSDTKSHSSSYVVASFDLLQRNIVGPVATVHVNQSKTSINIMTLSYTCLYVCTHCVIACPLLHQHSSTPLACTPCYCMSCRDPMYLCMPRWSVCNRPASPMRCLRT